MRRKTIQTAEETNLELVKSLLGAFARGDVIAAREMLTDDVRFHFPGRNPLSGEYKGKEPAIQLLVKIAHWTRNTLRIQLHDVLANEQHGVLMYTVTAKHKDRQIKYRYIDVYHFREGRICEVWGNVADDVEAFDAFYAV